MSGKIAILSLLLLACTFRPASAVDFNDDFGGATLGPEWTVDDPNGDDTISLTERAGYMRLRLASGTEDAWTGATWAAARNSAPFVLTSLVDPTDDFVVETMVDAATVNGGTMPDKFVAGIMLYDTDHETTPYYGSYRGYDMGFCLYRDSSYTGIVNPTIMAQGCYTTGTYSAGSLDLTKAYHLKMQRDGDAATWTCSYRQDGVSAWTPLCVYNDSDLNGGGVTGTMKLGLYAKTWVGGSTTPGADFGYFTIASVPEPSSIGLAVSALVGLLAYVLQRRK